MFESHFSSHDVLSNEKQQTGWFDLPYEMRSMIIEQMDAKTRGKLSSCSKLCCQEVRRSKNYINFIRVGDCHRDHSSDTSMYLVVCYQDYSSVMIFSKNYYEKEKCLISLESPFGKKIPKFDKKVDGTMEDIALNHFNRFVNDAIHLETIWIESYWFNFDKTSIKHLTKLETIRIKKNRSVDLSACGFLSIYQLISASKFVHIDATKIEIDQLIKFKASEFTVRYDSYTPEQIKQYFDSWKNNQINENVRKFEIGYVDDLYKVADNIFSGVDGRKRKGCREKSFFLENDAGKMAAIRTTNSTILVDFNGYFEDSDSSDEDNYYENDSSDDDYYDSDDM